MQHPVSNVSQVLDTRLQHKMLLPMGNQTYPKGVAVGFKEALELRADVLLSSWQAQALCCPTDDSPVFIHGLSVVSVDGCVINDSHGSSDTVSKAL